jgi:replicative DNA helicase
MLKPIPLPAAGADVPVREPPHNYEAEQALLGAIMLNNRAIERVSEFLRPEHFADPLYGRIYDACLALTGKNQLASPITLKSWIGHDPELQARGGESYLARLAAGVPTIINALDYGKVIYDAHLRRELIALGEEMVNDAFEPEAGQEAKDQLEATELKLFDLATTGQAEGGFKDFAKSMGSALDLAEAARKRDGALSGVTTGFRDLNAALGGLHATDFIVLAARPSMGKTALATNIAFNAARALREEVDESGQKKAVDGAVVAFFSLEMSAEQLATRIIAEQTRISSHDIRRGNIEQHDFDRLIETSQELHALPLYIDDTPALSISALRTRARRLARTRGLGLIVIDYLQLLSSPRAKGNSENRVQEISDITRGLKALAKDLKVPVLALSQLSRAVEQRDDKRPQLADLRESGTIEQDADVVMFIYREEYYTERRKPADGSEEMAKWQEDMSKVHNKAEVMIAKQRHGPIKNVEMFFDGRYTKFGDLDTHHDDHFPGD